MYSYFSRCHVTTNSVAPPPLYKLRTTHNSSIRSDEGLTLETSALEFLYGGQFTLSTPLIILKFLVLLGCPFGRYDLGTTPSAPCVEKVWILLFNVYLSLIAVDKFVMKVVKNNETVGRLPREYS